MTRIGKSELDIFPLNLGGNVFGWTADKSASFEILDAFVAGGGNFIDTADSYSAWIPGNKGGESETIIGEWLADRKPANVLIATKVGQHPEFRGQSAANVRAAAEASLNRLGVETIDLYYVHQDDQETLLEETAEAHAALVKDGLVRYTALSNFTADRLREWFRIANEMGAPLPVAFQPRYNLMERPGFEDELQPVAEELGLSVLPYSSLASGFLSGKYRSTEVGADAGSPRAQGAAKYATEAGLGVLDALQTVADAHNASVATVALAWLRNQSTIVAPIASASRVEQVAGLLESATIELSADELESISRASAAADN